MSLMELILVLAIIGIFAAVAVPRYAVSVARYRAEAAGRRIVADLALARANARASSAGQSVVFSVASNEYQLPGVSGLSASGADYTVVLSERPYEATLLSADFGGDAEVIFDGYGAPDSGGSAVVVVGTISKTVVLDPDTGKAQVQ